MPPFLSGIRRSRRFPIQRLHRSCLNVTHRTHGNFYNATVAQLGALVENAIDLNVETVLEQGLNGEAG